MKAVVKLVAGLLLLLILVAVIGAMFVSTEDIVKQVTTRVQQNTGRTLAINGPTELSLFPSFVLQLQDVRFANSKNGSRSDMMTMGSLDIHIPWMSLFSKALVIDKFVIEKLDILLELNAKGVPNWRLFEDAAALAQQPAVNDTDTTSRSQPLPEGFDISLGEIEIKQGRLTYIDHQTGKITKLEQLGLSIQLPSLHNPLEVDGTITYMSQTFNLKSVIDTPAAAINNQPFKVLLAMDSALLTLDYQGEVQEQGKLITGQLAVNGDSVKQILSWQQQPLAAKDNAFNQFSVNADIRFDGQTLNLAKLAAKLDELVFKGHAKIALSNKPKITLDIDLGMLNLNPYLPEPVASAPEPADAPAQPIVWDDSKIDLSALNQLDAEIKIKSTGLLVRKIKLADNQFSLQLNNGNLAVQLEKFNAYNGKGKGNVSLNTRQRPYQITTSFDLTGIDANPLLNDAAGFDKLLGKGQLNWTLTTAGQSQKDFVAGLAGNLGFNFTDGAVKGVNLAAIARSAQNILTGNLSGVSLDKDFNNAEKTDFAALSASFKFNKGVGVNMDLVLLNPFITVSGNGQVDLPKTQIDYKLKTKLTASMEGQHSETDKSGLSLPIKITGPFHQVKIRPDISSGAKDKAKDKVKDALKDKLKGLFGN